MTARSDRTRVEKITVSVYTVPTDAPESDGTLEWDATTMVLVEAAGGNHTGVGYSYTGVGAGTVITQHLAHVVEGMDVFDLPAAAVAMGQRVRNLGRSGLAMAAVSAVDNALWDLKARVLEIALVDLLGAAAEAVPVYGSGGFTSYSEERLREQLGGWAREGMGSVKMKIGRDAKADVGRVRAAREAIGDEVDLFVDANGAYRAREALRQAEVFAEARVSWFEEPVSSDNLEGLAMVRAGAPAGMNIAAGEYGDGAWYFRRMLDAEAVDVLQADATRCGGITGFLQAGKLCEAHGIPLSFHCAPAVHAAAACAAPGFWIGEYFHDHARIEEMFFEGVLQPVKGILQPDRSRAGCGLEFKRADAERYRVG